MNFLKSAEDAFKHAAEQAKHAAEHAKHAAEQATHSKPGWWHGGPGASAPAPDFMPRAPLPPAHGAEAQVPTLGARPGVGAGAGAVGGGHGQMPDDVAMRRHCAALERMVEIGLSPQAARVALRHLDAWLVGEEGQQEIAAAEAAAEAAGEPLLHVNDKVRLEGLVKNTAVNGMVGSLIAYGAADLRWKVQLSDNQIFWVRPRLLKFVEAAKRLETREVALREEQEAHELNLLEREEALRQMQEALEAERRAMDEQRHSLALDRARNMATVGVGRKNSEPTEFVLGKVTTKAAAEITPDRTLSSPQSTTDDLDEDGDEEDEEQEGEADEMWDMDWSSLGRGGAAAPAAGPLGAAGSPVLADVSPAQAGAASGSSAAGGGRRSPATPAAPSGYRAPGGTFMGLHPPPPSWSHLPEPRHGRASSPGRGEPEAPSLSSPDRDALQQKLEEKRRLAELHNGEDLTTNSRMEFDKGRMPGATPEVARKLEERRRKIEMEEEATEAPRVEA